MNRTITCAGWRAWAILVLALSLVALAPHTAPVLDAADVAANGAAAGRGTLLANHPIHTDALSAQAAATTAQPCHSRLTRARAG